MMLIYHPIGTESTDFCFTNNKIEDRTILLGKNGTKKNFVVSDARIPRRIVSATLDAALFTS